MSLAGRDGGLPGRRWQIAASVCALAVVVCGAYAGSSSRELGRLQAEQQSLAERERETQATLESTRAELARSQGRLARLDSDAHERAAANDEARRRLDKLERLLSTQFGRLARADMLLVSNAGDRFSVALAIPALFPLGRTQVTANGRALLCELAQAITQHHDGPIRVSGYQGASARQASSWQLSAARAASAAAVLERDCELNADRLYAVAHGPRETGPLGENVALELLLNPRD